MSFLVRTIMGLEVQCYGVFICYRIFGKKCLLKRMFRVKKKEGRKVRKNPKKERENRLLL